MEPTYVGIDIGGSKCAVVVGGEDGVVLDRQEWPSLAERGPDAMMLDILHHAMAFKDKHAPVRAGVSVGGPVDCRSGVVLSPPNLPGWDGIPLGRILQEHLQLPVAVEHDAAACCLAECRWGAGRGASCVVYLTCGSGFGAGLVLDGKARHASDGRSIELGHVRYRDDGPTAFGKRGSFEAWCAGHCLPRVAGWLFPERWSHRPPGGSELAKLAESGDADAWAVLEANATAVGEACAVLGDLLGPEAILLGSLARYLGPKWVGQVRARFAQHVLPSVAAGCRIEPAALGERLQDLSALVVAIANQ